MKFFHIFQMKTLNLKIEKFIVFFRVVQKFCIKKFENSQKAKNLIPQQIFSFV